MSSLPAGSSLRTAAALLGSTADMEPSSRPGLPQSSGPQPMTGSDRACSISVMTMRRNSGSGSMTSQRAGGSSASRRRDVL